MIAAHAAPRPEARELRACALAAVAEAGVVYLPLHLVLTESKALDLDVEAFAVPFVLAYVAGAVLACVLRTWRHLPIAAVALAAIGGVAVGHGDANRAVFMTVVALLAALRVVTFGLRDWRSPIEAELGWGALALGIETMVAIGAEPQWRPSLVVFVPTFFVAALASRATTVWTSGGVLDLDERVRASWIRRAVLGTGALVGAMALVVGLAVRDGIFDRIGRWLTPAADVAVSGFAWVVGQAARPIFWLVDRLGIDPNKMREILDRLRAGGLRHAHRGQAGPAALWQRILGLIVFAAVGYGIYRVIRRARARVGLADERSVPVATETSPVTEDAPPAPRRRLRRELPADVVRRLYAETLLALRRLDVRKDPALTPAEFVPEVAEACPEGAETFLELTLAYQDVRYGARVLDADRLRALAADHRRLLGALRRRSDEFRRARPSEG